MLLSSAPVFLVLLKGDFFSQTDGIHVALHAREMPSHEYVPRVRECLSRRSVTNFSPRWLEECIDWVVGELRSAGSSVS